MTDNNFISCIDEKVTWIVEFIVKQILLPPSTEDYGDKCYSESLGKWR